MYMYVHVYVNVYTCTCTCNLWGCGFSFFALYSLLLHSYLESVPIYVIVHIYVHVCTHCCSRSVNFLWTETSFLILALADLTACFILK